VGKKFFKRHNSRVWGIIQKNNAGVISSRIACLYQKEGPIICNRGNKSKNYRRGDYKIIHSRKIDEAADSLLLI
jgi:hypothetical protein